MSIAPVQIDEWESFINAGITLCQSTDRNRWALGDLAQRAERKYGDGSLNKLAYAINIRAKTFYEYHRVYAYYGESETTRVENLTWSHHREAMRLNDLEKSTWALNKASDKDWRVEKFNAILSRYLGKGKRADSGQTSDTLPDKPSTALISSFERHMNGECVMTLLLLDETKNFSFGQKVRVMITPTD